MTEIRTGWMSNEAARLVGTCWWSTPDGREVELTAAGPGEIDYRWPDKVCVGPVVAFVRKGRPAIEPLNPWGYCAP